MPERKYETAFKMFNADLTCTMGRGKYQFRPGEWHEEPESNCRRNGFHCAKNPLDCLTYYGNWDKSQCWLVELDGTVDEDDHDSKVSATRIRLARHLSLLDFVVAAGQYIVDHPRMPVHALVGVEEAEAGCNHFAVCRGKNPKAKGRKGDILLLLKEYGDAPEIEGAGLWVVGSDDRKPGVWYDVEGMEA